MQKTRNISKNQKRAIEEEGSFIDLNLPSGILWCKYNIGVINNNRLDFAKDWYGNYYACGEIYPKRTYTLFNYEYSKYNKDQTEDDVDVFTKYCNNIEFSYDGKLDNLTRLEQEDIPESQIRLGYSNLKLNMPTYNQYEELLQYTTKKWVKNYNGVSNLNGILFTSKEYKSASIFFPASGYKDDMLRRCGEAAGYWTSDVVTEACGLAWNLNIEKTHTSMIENSRSVGFNIRLVAY